MKLNNYKNIFLAGLLVLSACKPEVDVEPATSGSADFSAYIAVGDSQTAGFADNGLYRAGQINSFPNIIATQLKSVGGGTFNQPLFSEAQADGSGYKKLSSFVNGSPVITDVQATAVRTTIPIVLFTKYTGNNNNYGIPALKVQQITAPQVGNANPYFERMLPGSFPTNNTTYLDFITAKPYTFFTCWLGNNDALLYAVNGGVGETLTPTAQFVPLYTALVDRLTTGGKKGAVATIPDVTAIPYFTTVTVPAILASVQRAVPTAKLYINARATSDLTNTTYAVREATAADLVILTFPTTLIGGTAFYGLTPANPIENKYILDANEVKLIQEHVIAYNQTINSVAAAKGLAVFDAFGFLNNLKKGIVIDGVNLNASFIIGGVFSLDGVHLTPKGYAIEANEFIKTINAKYNSSVPLASVSAFASVTFP
ncbi:SGNH/GDSL hydrolase family protein [Mucilaginibacter terrae]|uniref:SGNH/GDSL hydrolase family protein n=1 Tax=Mucilaginibacter terrae TaxID=1955052 RepID=UPI0036371247